MESFLFANLGSKLSGKATNRRWTWRGSNPRPDTLTYNGYTCFFGALHPRHSLTHELRLGVGYHHKVRPKSDSTTGFLKEPGNFLGC